MNRQRLGEILVSRGIIDPGQLSEALTRQQRGERNPIGLILVQMGLVDPDEVARSLAQQFGFPYVDPTRTKVDPNLVWKLPKEMAEGRLVVPIDQLPSGIIRVAMANPRDINALRDVEFVLHTSVTPVVASVPKLQEIIRRFYNIEHTAHQLLSGVSPELRAAAVGMGLELDSTKIAAALKDGTSNRTYVDLLNFLLVNAFERKASDIHLEPQSDDLRIRFRVDGLLREVLTLPSFASKPLISRIKVVGKLDLSAYNKPQDGKVSANLQGRKLDLRVSIVPSQYGESVVIRLLDSAMLQTDLGELGWQPRALGSYYRMVSQPQGLVLCVGPTGSGKSTTLYATIHRLRSETTSIITVEDPIEYSLPGITQVQVNEKTGMVFGTVIRSLLRQDPNVIVIGEIRDSETADAALEAANTGHLVLSTLHTNYAVTTITRLLDLKVPPYLLGSTLIGIVAQRLVRRVCPVCSVVGEAEEEDWHRLGIEPVDLGKNVRRAGTGCTTCGFIGYSGRIGVIEVLNISDSIRQLIIENATEEKIWRTAREEGLFTLFDDALLKVSNGLTTLEELARVVPVDPWRDEPVSRHSGTDVVENTVVARVKFPPMEIGPDDTTVHDLDLEALEMLEPEISGPATILIADDAEEILQLVAITLEDEFKILLAHDGLEALEQANSHHPDLLILDVMMPGMSGFDVCEHLKENPKTSSIPVLFLSARGERPHVKRGFHVGADDYLAKPFDPEELLLRVRALIRRSSRARALA